MREAIDSYSRCSARRSARWIRPRDISLMALVAWLLPCTTLAQTQGVCGTAANFQVDGNLNCFEPAVSDGNTDWYTAANQSCLGLFTPNPPGLCADVANPTSSFRRDPHWAGNAADSTVFSGMSNKNNDDISANAEPWEWAPKSGDPGKDDITETYVTSRVDANSDR